MSQAFFGSKKNTSSGRNGYQLKKSILKTVAKILVGIVGLLSVACIAFAAVSFIPGFKPKTSNPGSQNDQSVLAATTEQATKLFGTVTFNIPAIFNDTVAFKKEITVDAKSFFNQDITVNNKNVDLGTGDLTAANVLYGVTAGKGIKSTGGQNPTLSIDNAVTSFQGATGDITLAAGSGISISGTTITNTAKGGNSFGTVSDGSNTFSAGSTNDTVTFAAGSGVTILTDTSNKKLTFSSTGGLSGLVTNGILYAISSNNATSLTPGTSGYILQSNGAGSAPSWVVNSGSTPSFSVITSGTNTTAAMMVDSGATLNFSGTGVINASQLLGATWASPNAIGNTAANIGAFTALSASGLISANGGLTVASGQSLTLSGFSAGIGRFNSSGVLSSSAVDLSTGDVTNILPLSKGGTNANLAAVQGGIVYSGASALAITSAGSGGQCLLSAGTGAPTWGSCATGASNYWQVNGSVLSPYNTNLDLAIGGTATSSALFQVFGTTGNATTSGNFTFAGSSPTVTALNGQPISFNTSVGGGAGSTRLTILNNGNLGIGTTNPGVKLDVFNGTVRIDQQKFTPGLTLRNTVGIAGDQSPNLQFVSFNGNARNIRAADTYLAILNGIGSETFRVYDNQFTYTGVGVGFGTTTPGNATLVLNQTNPSGNGDIFSASTSGITKFTIANTGAITDKNYTAAGGMFFADNTGLFIQTSAGNSSQCLIGGAIPSWATCSTGNNGINYWQLNSNVLSPYNTTVDLAVGGNATSSALFQVFANTGNATTSGNFTFANAGVIQSTQNQNLTLGGGTTGNIILSPLNGTGNVGIGTTSPTTHLFITNGNSNATTDQLALGSGSPAFLRLGTDNSDNSYIASNATMIGSSNTWNYVSTGAYSGQASRMQMNGSISFFTANGGANPLTWSQKMLLDNTGNVGIGNGSPLARLDVGGNASISGNITFTGAPSNIIALNGQPLQFNTSVGGGTGSTRMTILNNGSVGIGTTNPVFTLDVTGNIRATSSINSNAGMSALSFSNINNSNNARIQTVNNGTVIDRNVADANSALIVQQLNAGSTGDILQLKNNSSTVFDVSQAGFVGIGNILPGNASLVVNQQNSSGDIFSASQGGTLKFSIANSGVITDKSYTTGGGIFFADNTGLFTQTGVGNSSQCLTGGTTPSWATCATGANGTNYWQLNSSVLSPANASYDLSIGGSATSSAFQVFAGANGIIPAGTASISGQLSFSASSKVDLLNNSTLGFYTSVGGNTGESANPALFVSSNGNIGIGTTNPSAGLQIAPPNNQLASLKLTSTTWGGNAIFFGTNGGSNAGAIEYSITVPNGIEFQTNGTGGTVDRLIINQFGKIGAGITGANAGLIGNAEFLVNQPNSAGDIFTASQGGTTKFTITNTGGITDSNYTTLGGVFFADSTGLFTQTGTGTSSQCLIGGATPTWSTCSTGANGTNYWQLNSSVLSPANSSYDLAVGGSATSSALFQVFGATGNATTSGNLTFAGSSPTITALNGQSISFNTSVGGGAGSTRFYIANNGNIGIGTNNPSSLLYVNGVSTFTGTMNASTIINQNGSGVINGITFKNYNSTNNARLRVLDTGTIIDRNIADSNPALIVNQINASSTGDLFTASFAGVPKFTIGNGGAITDTNYTTSGGILFADNTGLFTQTSAGNSSQCLIGGTIPSWATCSTGNNGINYWQLNSNVLSPYNTTVDLAVGGNATSSALFQVFANTGNATTSGNFTFANAGVIQTTQNQNLTLGGGTTGNIILSPLNGTGNVGIGTTIPAAKLDVNGAASVSGNLTFYGGARTIQTNLNQALTIGGNTTGNIILDPSQSAGNYVVVRSNGSVAGQGALRFDQNSVNFYTMWTTGTGTVANSNLAIGFDGTNASNQLIGLTGTGVLNIGTSGALDQTGLYISKSLANASIVANQGGLGAIFTGSASGQTKFTLANTGAITDTNYTTAGGVFFADTNGLLTQTGTSTSSQCLIGGATPTWATCATGSNGVNYWQLNSSVLSPANSSYDLAIGGSATSSALFQVFANTGNATTSGNLTFTGSSPTITALNGQPISFNTSVGGGAGLTRFYIANNGNIGIGTTNVGVSYLTTFNLPASVGNFMQFTSTNNGQYGIIGTSATNQLKILSSVANLIFGTNTTETMRIDTKGNLGINTTSPIAALDVHSITGTVSTASISGQTSFASLVVDQSGVGDIFSASQSGGTRFTIGQDGTLTDSKYQTNGGVFFANGSGVFAQTAQGAAHTFLGGNGAGVPTFNAIDLSSADVSNVLGVSNGGLGANLSSGAAIGDLLYASSTTAFARLADVATGQCLISGGTGTAPSWGNCATGSNGTNLWQLNSNVISPYNSTLDLAVGGTATGSAFQIFALANGLIPAGTASTSGNITFTGSSATITALNGSNLSFNTSVGGGAGSTRMTILNNGNVGIGTANPGYNLHVVASTADVATVETTSSSSFSEFALKNNNAAIGGLVFGGTNYSGYAGNGALNLVNSATNPIAFYTGGSVLSNEKLRITNAGNIGINTSNPLAILDVRGIGNTTLSGTIPVASISGQTSFASLVVDQSGVGDIFSASQSGGTRFTIGQDGTLTDSKYQTNGGVFFANGSGTFTQTAQGAAHTFLRGNGAGAPTFNAIDLSSTDVANTLGVGNGGTGVASIANGTLLYGAGTTTPMNQLAIGTTNQCLLSNGTVPTWGSCALGTNYWQVNSNILSPANSNYDLTIGGNATSSAFQVFALASNGVPAGTASTSGNLVFNTAAAIQTTANQNLTLGGGTTGNIILNPLNANGNVGINTASPTNTLSVNGTELVLGHGSFGAGSSVNQNDFFSNAQSSVLNVQEVFTSCGSICNGIDQLLVARPTVAAISNNLYGINNVVGLSATATKNLTGGVWGEFSQFYNASSRVTNLSYGLQARSENRSTGSITTAYGVFGEVEQSGGGTGAITTGYGGYFHVLNSGAGTIGTGYGVYIDAASNVGTFTNNYGLYIKDQNGVGSTNSYQLYSEGGTAGTNKSYIGGVLGIGSNATPNSKLFVANSGQLPLGKSLVVFDQYENQDIFSASFSGTTKFTIQNSGALKDANYTTSGGVFFADTNGLFTQTGTSTSSQCLIGGATPTWATCATGANGTNYWQLNSKVLSPANSTYDLAIGGNATSSALFQVFANTGNATTSGNFTFANAGIIQSAQNQNLTLGGNTTGNIILNPLNGNGNVGIGTTNPTDILNIENNGDTYVKAVATGGAGQIAGIKLQRGTTSDIYTDYSIYDSGGNLSFDQSLNGTTTTRLFIGDVGNGIGIGTTSPLASLDIRGNNYATPVASLSGATGKATLVLDQSGGTGDLFTASQSGGTRFTIGQDGTLTDSKYQTNGGMFFANGSGVFTQTAQGASHTFLRGNGAGAPTFNAIDVSSADVTNALGVGNGGLGANLSSGAAIGDLLYASSTTAFARLADVATGQCLISGGIGTAPSWATCATGSNGTNYWQLNNKVLSPYNQTLDLSVGGTATGSAFQIFALASNGVPAGTASTSGNFVFNTAAAIQTTTNQNLTLGGGTTGNIILSPLNGNGNVGINTANPTTALDVTGSIKTSGTITLPNNNSLTGVSNFIQFNNGISFGGATTNNISNTGAATLLSGAFSNTGNAITLSGNGANIAFTGTSGNNQITTVSNQNLYLMPNGTGEIGINTLTPLALFDARANQYTTPVASISGATGKATFVIDQSGVGDIITASESGATRFVVDRSGDVKLAAGAKLQPLADSTSALNIANAAGTNFVNIDTTNKKVRIGTTFSVYNGATDYALHVGGGTSAKGTVLENATSTVLDLWSDANGGSEMSFQLGGVRTGDFALTDGSNTKIYYSANKIGIGNNNTNPLATLDVKTTDYTVPVASFSGATGKATLVLDQSGGTGDIFSASQSGGTRFTIGSNGSILASNYLTAGGVLYTNGSGLFQQTSTSTSSQCLIGGVTPTWATCATGANGINYWQLNSSVLSPANSTYDLTIGGSATGSAFQVFAGTNGSIPSGTASTSGYLSFTNAASQVNILNNSTLGFYNSVKGDAGIGATPALFIANNGNIGIGTNTPVNFGVQLGAGVSLGPGATDSISLGSSNREFRDIYDASLHVKRNLEVGSTTLANFGNAGTQPVASFSGTTSFASMVVDQSGAGDLFTASQSGGTRFTIGQDGTLTDSKYQTNGGVLFANGSGVFTQTAQGAAHTFLRGNGVGAPTFNAIDLSTTDVSNVLGVSNGGLGANLSGGAAIGDLLYANSTTAFARLADVATGQCLTSGGVGAAPSWATCATGSNGTNYWQLNSNVLSPANSNYDLAIGGTATGSAFQIFALANGSVPAGTASTSGNLIFTGSASTIQTTKNQNLTIGGGTTGSITLAPLNGAAGSILTLNTNTIALGGTNTSITNTGANTLTINSGSTGNINFFSTANTLTSGGNLSLNGTLAVNQGGTSATKTNIDANGNILPGSSGGANIGSVTLPWNTIYANNSISTASSGSNGFWQLNSKVLSPANTTYDLAIGGSATGSAFQVFAGANGTIPAGTASTSGNLSFAGGGSQKVDLLNNSSLGFYNSVGGNTGESGTPALYINNTGNIGIGTTTTTNALQVAGTIGIQNSNVITGVANFTQFSQGISVGNGTTFKIDNLGNANLLTGTFTSTGNAIILSGNGANIAFTGTSGNNQITTASNQNLYLMPNGTGQIGLNTLTPSALFDVRANQYTTPVASFSGATGKATLVLDNSGVGDLLTASQAGGTRFTIGNNGSITSSNYKTSGGVFFGNGSGVFTQTAQGAASQCLIGGATPTWATCATGANGTNLWQLSSNVISPYNQTLDLAIGGQATSSAKFQVFAGANGTIPAGTASTSGNLTFASSGTNKINLLNNSNVGFYSSVGGDAGIANPALFIGNSGNGSSSVGINTATPLASLDVRGASTWYDSGYANKKKITIDHTKVTGGADLTNFPVLISFTDPNFKTSANGGSVKNNNGYDIVFTNATESTKLDHEIEKYVTTTGEVEMWVRIPTLSASTDTVIYVYYGNNSTTTSQENKTGVWNPNGDTTFNGVWHMKEDPSGSAPQMKDSTTNHNDGTSTGMTSGNLVAGQIDGATSFDGNTTHISAPDASSLDPLNNFTISTWVKFNSLSTSHICGSASTNSEQMLFKRNAVTTTFEGYSVSKNASNQFSFTMSPGFFGQTSINSNTTVSTGTWYFVTTTFNNPTMTLWVNGTAEVTGNHANNAVYGTRPLFFGRTGECGGSGEGNFDAWLNGVLDDVRIESASRSAGWIGTEFNNENTPSSFYTVGSAIAEGSPTGIAVASMSGNLSLFVPSSSNPGTTLNILNGGSFNLQTSTGGDTGLTPRLSLTNSGNVGIGTAVPLDKLDIEGGNVRIGAQTNSTTAFSRISGGTAGTIGSFSQGSIASISAKAIWNGSLYVGTQISGKAEVLQYSGTSGTWTVMNAGAAGTGQIEGGSSKTTAIDCVCSMTVYNEELYIGTGKVGGAEVYKLSDPTNKIWTKVSGAVGTIGPDSSIDAVTSMVVYDGKLYIGTKKTNAARVDRYDGSTTWNQLNTTAGQFSNLAPGNTSNIDAVTSMVVANNRLYIGTTEPTGAEVYWYAGGTNTAAAFQRANSAAGTFVGSSFDGVSTMAVYNGKLIIGVNENVGNTSINKAEVDRLDDVTGSGSAQTAWVRMSNSAGKISPNGTTNIDSVNAMTVYNGRLYVGTYEKDKAEIYRYDGDGSTVTSWTVVSNATAGTIDGGGNTTAIDGVGVMIPYNGSLIAGTWEPAKAEVYQYTDISDQSYALKFHALPTYGGGEQNGLTNDASIVFAASSSANLGINNSNNNTGSFLFSHGIITGAGAYDVAEDYPTRDDTLQPGDLVALDTNEDGMVKKASGLADAIVGVYSENPGFELSQKDATINGGRAVPIALAGRVPVKVSTINGPIANGDMLTASSIPGVAMKANKAGMVLGRAMGSYTNADPNAVGKIMTFLNLSWWDPGMQLTASGDLSVPGNPTNAAPLANTVNAIETAIASNSATLSVQQPKNTDLASAAQLADLSSKIKDLQTSTASIGAQLAKLSQIDELTSRVSLLEKAIPLLTSLTASGSSSSPLTENQDATVSGTLSVLGKALLSDVGITGQLSMGLLKINGLDQLGNASINTFGGALKLQSDALEAIDIMNGKIVIDTLGNMKVNAEVTAKKYNVDTTDVAAASVGQSIIPAGKTQLIVKTQAVSGNSKIFLTPHVPAVLGITDQTKGVSFTVTIDKVQTADVKFDWFIVN